MYFCVCALTRMYEMHLYMHIQTQAYIHAYKQKIRIRDVECLTNGVWFAQTFGRYDDMRSAVENIDFQSTILSRFDLIFIIRDERNEERDERIARHVMNLHAGNMAAVEVCTRDHLDVRMHAGMQMFVHVHTNVRVLTMIARLRILS
jgi:hypothetical protein